jgi:hypothetical protein
VAEKDRERERERERICERWQRKTESEKLYVRDGRKRERERETKGAVPNVIKLFTSAIY